jgi:predicted transcriptional regulator
MAAMTTREFYQSPRYTRLKIHLLKKRISQHEIARQLGVSYSYVNMLLCGRRVSEHYTAKLIELGIPEQLMPHQSPVGRQAKTLQGQAA